MEKKIEDAYHEVTGKKVEGGKKKIPIGVSAETSDKIYCQIPVMVYHL